MSEEVEEWRDVVGYEGRYQVSSLGRVKSLERTLSLRDGRSFRVRERILALAIKDKHYRSVTLSIAGRQLAYAVHALVLNAFIGPKPAGYEGRHHDNDGSNNRLDNLSWSTHVENIADKQKFGTSGKGSQNSQAKLTEEIVLELKTRLAVRVRGDMTKIAHEYGLRPIDVARIIRGERWSHV